MTREEVELKAKNQAALDQVLALVPVNTFQQIKDALSDSRCTHSYLVADQQLREPQDDDFVLGDVCFEQARSHGVHWR